MADEISDDEIAAGIERLEQRNAEVAADEMFMLVAPVLMAAVDPLIDRAEDIHAIRGAKNHDLGQDTRQKLEHIYGELEHITAIIRGEA